MAGTVFPGIPVVPAPRRVDAVLVVRSEPLVAIREILGISIHDVVNDRRTGGIVREFYRIARRIENESWLRRRLREAEYDAWVAAHL